MRTQSMKILQMIFAALGHFTVQLDKNLNDCFMLEKFTFQNFIVRVPGNSIIDKVKVSILRFHLISKQHTSSF